jgi:RND family efflux transporter MFP subunit
MKPNSYKKHFWIIVPALILIFIVSLLTWRILERKRLKAIDSLAKTENVLPVKVIQAEVSDIVKFTRCSGIIQAWQKAIILSEVTGKVQSIRAKVGDQLEPGSPILKVDDEMQKYKVEQAEANVLQLEANCETSIRELQRKKSLFKNKVISDYEFDIAKSKAKADRALLDAAKASLKIARRDLRETLITSPIKGILAECTVDIGSNVGRTTNVATIVNIDRIKIKVGVSDLEIAEIRIDQTVEIETDAYPQEKFIGSVYSVGTKADDATLSFPVEIVLENNQSSILKPGMVARIAIKTGVYSNMIPLPQEVMLGNERQNYVWTVKNGRACKVRIDPLDLVESHIIIQNIFNPNQLVIVSGQEGLFEGCRVRIIEEENKEYKESTNQEIRKFVHTEVPQFLSQHYHRL